MYCTSKNPPYGRVPIRRTGLDEEKVKEEQSLAEERDKWVEGGRNSTAKEEEEHHILYLFCCCAFN